MGEIIEVEIGKLENEYTVAVHSMAPARDPLWDYAIALLVS
jgi:hypothetical protein